MNGGNKANVSSKPRGSNAVIVGIVTVMMVLMMMIIIVLDG